MFKSFADDLRDALPRYTATGLQGLLIFAALAWAQAQWPQATMYFVIAVLVEWTLRIINPFEPRQ